MLYLYLYQFLVWPYQFLFIYFKQIDLKNDTNNSLEDNAFDNKIFQIENSSDSSYSENSSEEG